jgi:hypothetical protein
MDLQRIHAKVIGYLGVILLFPGTMTAFIAYAIINGEKDYGDHDGPMPLYSNMFRFWPLAGNLTFGLGVSFLCIGLLSHRQAAGQDIPTIFFISTTFSVFCALGVVASAEDYGYHAMAVVHGLFFIGFLAGSFFTFFVLFRMNFVDHNPKKRDLNKTEIFMNFVVAFVFSSGLGAFVAGVILAFTQSSRDKIQALASFEFLLLLSYTLGYGILCYKDQLFPEHYNQPIANIYLFYKYYRLN